MVLGDNRRSLGISVMEYNGVRTYKGIGYYELDCRYETFKKKMIRKLLNISMINSQYPQMLYKLRNHRSWLLMTKAAAGGYRWGMSLYSDLTNQLCIANMS